MCRGLHSTPLPALMSADIALASVYTKSASASSLPPPAPGPRKLSEPIVGLPSLRRRKSSVGVSKRPDGSDSDETGHDVAESSKNSPTSYRRRARTMLPTGNPIIKHKRQVSGPEVLHSIDESSVRTVAPSARTFRPAYM